jgi:hypothetical protein
MGSRLDLGGLGDELGGTGLRVLEPLLELDLAVQDEGIVLVVRVLELAAVAEEVDALVVVKADLMAWGRGGAGRGGAGRGGAGRGGATRRDAARRDATRRDAMP